MTTSRSKLIRAAAFAIGTAARVAIPAAFTAALLVPAHVATAQQIKAVDPYFVTVTKDSVPMKCADGGIFYAVSILKTGQVLRVDGEGPGWLRVEYLPGMKAYVKAAEATAEAGGKNIRLSRPSRLMAANVQPSRPWQFLLDSELPAGASFSVLDTVKGTDGAVEGYLVPAPTQARGYVKSDQVRRATAEETAAATPSQPAVETAKTEPTKPATPDDSVQASKPAETTPAEVTPAETTPVVPVVAVPPTPEAPKLKAIKDLETLRTLFNGAMKKGVNEEEIKTVVAEFNRTIASLGATAEDQSIHQAIASRKEALTLRLDIFETEKKVREAGLAWDATELRHREFVDDVERQAIYTIVGRIVPSTVYDGRRGMPLMYRIESADSSSTRTLGYVVPREGVDLLSVSGKVVGIVGESRMDEALRLNLVAARRVTVLNPAGTPRPIETTPSDEPTGPAEATGSNEKPGE